jgi:predicted nucleic acid-binding protein
VTGLVVDASVAIKWYVEEDDSETAHRILVSPPLLHAPALLKLELANGLWKNWRRKIVTIDQAGEAIESIDRTIGAWHDTGGLFAPAVKLAFDLDHVVYDCIYLALARQLGIPLITADKRLLAIAPEGLVVALEDWKP